MVVKFADKRVKPDDRHDGNSFMHQDLLFNERDDDGDGILVHDTLVKQRPFPVLHDRPHERGQPVAAARPPLAFREDGPAVLFGDDVILSSRSVQGFYGIDGNGKLIFFKNECRQPLEVLPDRPFGHCLELPDAPDIFEVRVAGPVRILWNISYGKTLPADSHLHAVLHIINEREVKMKEPGRLSLADIMREYVLTVNTM
jgi:hypothetical protein